MAWNPPKSPWNLVQEPYFGDEWKVLVCCILLNLTTHKQVRKILPEFFKRYPGPCSMILADEDELKDHLQSLGLVNKRAKTLIFVFQKSMGLLRKRKQNKIA